MADTQALLNLATEFPGAFQDPDALLSQSSLPPQEFSPLAALLALQDEFPSAFQDPALASEMAELEVAIASPSDEEDPAAPTLAWPSNYQPALHQQRSTFTWGQLDVTLTYGESGLAQIWVTVGKSGTEVQSLCEAICRLANALLQQGMPAADIARQLRGIRGADSEGMGPNRILGLADFIGKALQEAPAAIATSPATSVVSTPEALTDPVLPVSSTDTPVAEPAHSHEWAGLDDSNHRMGVCPECGSELHAMNGCSGGACNVCGYSSCS